MAAVPNNRSQRPAFRRVCVTHFSHNHPLRPVNVEEKEELICSACGLDLLGSAYECTKSNCEFFIHKPCFLLRRKIQHASHPDHPLTLLASPPYKSDFDSFTCDACQDYGTGFVYHCSICKFNLHIGCASLPNTVNHIGHDHHLTLFYSVSSACAGALSFACDVCKETMPNESNWIYYCAECDYGAHLRCVNQETKQSSCFSLEPVVRHKSHTEHSLTLLPSPPKSYPNKSFICNACDGLGVGFDYHCQPCHFDLHIDCASLPETMKDIKHEHPLTLHYSSSCNKGFTNFLCDCCKKQISIRRWIYYCEKCNYGLHMSCITPAW